MAAAKIRMEYAEMMWKQRQEGKALGIIHKKDIEAKKEISISKWSRMMRMLSGM